jgi:hypothetical protein
MNFYLLTIRRQNHDDTISIPEVDGAEFSAG